MCLRCVFSVRHVLSCSGGKDSVATLILCHEYPERYPLDTAVFADIWFDREKRISATNPLQLDFILNVLKPKAEKWGIEFRIIRSEKSYLDVFHHQIERPLKYPEHKGMAYGFPGALRGMCAVKRDCKEKAIRDFRKAYGDCVSYVGIAADETRRLSGLREGTVSVLSELGYTERMAYDLCQRYGLLSPVYGLSGPDGKKQWRDGCWCCPFAKEQEHLLVKRLLPDAWAEYVDLGRDTKGLAFPKWNVFSEETLPERDARLEDILKKECGSRSA